MCYGCVKRIMSDQGIVFSKNELTALNKIQALSGYGIEGGEFKPVISCSFKDFQGITNQEEFVSLINKSFKLNGALSIMTKEEFDKFKQSWKALSGSEPDLESDTNTGEKILIRVHPRFISMLIQAVTD